MRKCKLAFGSEYAECSIPGLVVLDEEMPFDAVVDGVGIVLQIWRRGLIWLHS
jgi:hypothetical protein